jgi:hypothetical protein
MFFKKVMFNTLRVNEVWFIRKGADCSKQGGNKWQKQY